MAKKTPAPDDLTQSEQIELWNWNCSDRGFGVSKRQLRELVDACLEHHGAHCSGCGKASCRHEFASWVRACRKWVRNEVGEFGPKAGRHYRRSAWPKDQIKRPEAHVSRSQVHGEPASGVPAASPLSEELIPIPDSLFDAIGGKL